MQNKQRTNLDNLSTVGNELSEEHMSLVNGDRWLPRTVELTYRGYPDVMFDW